MDNTSVKQSIIKTFFVFHPILMKLGEVVVRMGWVLQFHQVSSKSDEKKVLIIDCLTEVSSVQVPLRSC